MKTPERLVHVAGNLRLNHAPRYVVKTTLVFIVRSQKCSEAVNLISKSKIQNDIKTHSHLEKKYSGMNIQVKTILWTSEMYFKKTKVRRKTWDSEGNWTGLWEYFLWCLEVCGFWNYCTLAPSKATISPFPCPLLQIRHAGDDSQKLVLRIY